MGAREMCNIRYFRSVWFPYLKYRFDRVDMDTRRSPFLKLFKTC